MKWITITTTVLITLLLLGSGCIDSNNGNQGTTKYRTLSQISISILNLNYTEIKNINFSDAKNKLENKGYVVDNNTDTTTSYGIACSKLHLRIILRGYAVGEIEETLFSGTFSPDNRTPEMDQENETDAAITFLKERMKEVAIAANVTVTDAHFKNASVVVSYTT